MVKRIATTSVLLALAASVLLADFSYEETTRVTGGALVGAMKVMGVFSKQARQINEPIRSTVAVKGDRMIHLSPMHGSIIDLAKETITSIDFEKKTYSVMTFAQMKQAMERMAEQMKQQKSTEGAELNFKASVKSTGETKNINGQPARQVILKLEMEGTDQKSGQKGSMVVTSDMWMVPRVAGYEEIADFHKRMAEKLNWTPGGNMFMNRPDLAKGMAEAGKEIAKMDGMPVYQTLRMGAAGMEPAGGSPPPQQAQPQPPPQQTQQPTAGGALGGALGGRLGRFGGLGRKKPDQQTQTQTQSQTPPPAQDSSSAAGALIEMVTESSNFSSAPVDPSRFEVPGAFQQVEPEMRRVTR